CGSASCSSRTTVRSGGRWRVRACSASSRCRRRCSTACAAGSTRRTIATASRSRPRCRWRGSSSATLAGWNAHRDEAPRGGDAASPIMLCPARLFVPVSDGEDAMDTQVRDPATQGYVFNHTMLRVKDPKVSLDFYTRVLGFTLVRTVHFEEAKFSLYFLVLVDDPGVIPEGDAERKEWLARQRGVLELTHNHGTETQEGPVYH